MSFTYKNRVITLDNYKSIFNECTPDILDEIRSAILDDTQIGAFIKKCGIDSYKLGQIRMALREMIPLEYINTNMTGRTIYMIRRCMDGGYDISSLIKYVENGSLLVNAKSLEKLTEYIYVGADISKIDFTQINSNLIDIICKGLIEGYPMWLIIDPEVDMTVEKIKALQRGMQLGIDVHPFIYQNWNNEQLYLMYSYCEQVDLNKFLPYVNSNFDSDMLRVLLNMSMKNLPINELCVKDSDGIPVYNSYQATEISYAIEDGTLTYEMLNPKLSDLEIKELHNEELYNRQAKKDI